MSRSTPLCHVSAIPSSDGWASSSLFVLTGIVPVLDAVGVSGADQEQRRKQEQYDLNGRSMGFGQHDRLLAGAAGKGASSYCSGSGQLHVAAGIIGCCPIVRIRKTGADIGSPLSAWQALASAVECCSIALAPVTGEGPAGESRMKAGRGLPQIKGA